MAATTASVTADLTVAVALSEVGLTAGGSAPVEDSAEPRPTEEWLDRSRRTVAELIDTDLVRTISGWFTSDPELVEDQAPAEEPAAGPGTDPGFGPLPPGLGTVDVMRLSLDALQKVVTRYRLAGYPPDVMITVPKAACRTLDFHRAEEMIALGRARATAVLDERDSALATGDD